MKWIKGKQRIAFIIFDLLTTTGILGLETSESGHSFQFAVVWFCVFFRETEQQFLKKLMIDTDDRIVHIVAGGRSAIDLSDSSDGSQQFSFETMTSWSFYILVLL